MAGKISEGISTIGVARRLDQRFINGRHLSHRLIKLGIDASLIGAEQAQIARILKARNHCFQPRHQNPLIGFPGLVGEA